MIPNYVLAWIMIIIGLCEAIAMTILLVAGFRSIRFWARQVGKNIRLSERYGLSLSPKLLRNSWPAFKGYIKEHHKFYWLTAVAMGIWILTPVVLVIIIILSRLK